jgi:hypothetical protein
MPSATRRISAVASAIAPRPSSRTTAATSGALQNP